MNIALTDELQRRLRMRVEGGQCPNEEAVIEEALKRFLTEEPARGGVRTSDAIELQDERLPGPFLEDETVAAPVELPRPGQEVARSYLLDVARQPDRFPGE
jgi:hypothetical protein